MFNLLLKMKSLIACAADEGAGAFDDGDSGLRGILEIGRSPQSSTSAGLLDGIASPLTPLSHSRNRISNGNSAGIGAPVYTRSTLSGVESAPPTSVAVLAEILLRSPRKFFIFIIKIYIYRIKVSKIIMIYLFI